MQRPQGERKRSTAAKKRSGGVRETRLSEKRRLRERGGAKRKAPKRKGGAKRKAPKRKGGAKKRKR